MTNDHARRSIALVALVAEDEPLFRMQTADLLADAGFEVIEVANAAHALAQFETQAPIALLFTDVRMPGRMNGLTLAHEVDRRWPNTSIIICSGMGTLDQTALPAKAVFFDKPYLTDRVSAAIRTALDGAETPGS